MSRDPNGPGHHESGLHWVDTGYDFMPMGWTPNPIVNGPGLRLCMLKGPPQPDIYIFSTKIMQINFKMD